MSTVRMTKESCLLDLFQAEFCPPLDSSLIAAIVADYVHTDTKSTPSAQIDTLRTILNQLAAQAEQELQDSDLLSEQLFNAQISPSSVTDETYDTQDFLSSASAETSPTACSSASSDTSSQHSFNTPLGFLQAAFPHVPMHKLKGVLAKKSDAGDLDMEAIVEGLLTSEYVRELEERGLEGLEDEELVELDWETVEPKKKASPPSSSKVNKKSKKRGTTITLVDIRQKQHEHPAPTSPRIAAPDPWTQLSSVASYLSTLIPTYSASYFQSIFHSPEHTTPAKALRSALQTASSSPSEEVQSQEASSLYGMLELLRAFPQYYELNSEERDQIAYDAQLALRATHGQPDRAIDIVWLLFDLDSDFMSKQYDWSVYHSPVPLSPSLATAREGVRKSPRHQLPSGPPPIPPPPRPRSRSPTAEKRTVTPPNAWKTIPQRQPIGSHPLADVIPAYKRKARGSGNGSGNGKGGKGDDVGELTQSSRHHIHFLMQQRREALREAGKAWQRGNTKTRGGEVAFYYAERARELQQQAMEEQLDIARNMVQAKRVNSLNGDSVDLHGTTVAEAIQIVNDILKEGRTTPSRPLRVITGRGTHSVNGVGVLGPAIKNKLMEEGWNISSFQGGLVVRGRSAWRT